MIKLNPPIFICILILLFAGCAEEIIEYDSVPVSDATESSQSRGSASLRTDAGYTFLRANSKLYYLFNNLTGSDGSVIAAGNAGLSDLGPSARNATPMRSPQVDDVTVGGVTAKALRSHLTESVASGATGTTLFQNSSFEIYAKIRFEDGIIPSGDRFVCGVSGSNRIACGISPDGRAFMIYQIGSGANNISIYGTSTAILTDGVNADVVIRWRFDFDANAFTIYVNGAARTMSKFYGADVSVFNPSGFTNNSSFYVGSEFDGAAPKSNPSDFSMSGFAVTRLLSASEAATATSAFTTTASSPVETPSTGAYDIYVAANGNDNNPGTVNAPKLTVQAGISAIAALGGSGRKLKIGIGMFTLPAFQNVPLNCSLIEGAGIGNTIITGNSSLFRGFSVTPAQSLFYMISNSTATGNHTVKNLTLDGNNRGINAGIGVYKRNGITVENVRFQNFNSAGFMVFHAANGYLKNCQWYMSSGETSGYTGGASIMFNVDNYKWEGGSVDASTYQRGFAIKCLPPDAATPVPMYSNISISNMTINVHPYCNYGGGMFASFALEFHTGKFNNVEIFNNKITSGVAVSALTIFNESGQGPFRIHHNDITMVGDQRVTGAVEAFAHYLEIDNNYIHGAVNSLTYQGGLNNPGYTVGMYIHHNIVEFGGVSVQNFISSTRMRWVNFRLRHNTFIAMVPVIGRAVVANDQYSGTPSSITIENNAFHGRLHDFLLHTQSGKSGFTGVVRNNKSTDSNLIKISNTVSNGVAASANQLHGAGNSLGLKLAGTKPSPYCQPNTGSVLIGTAYGGGDIGAISH